MGKHGPCNHCGITSTPLWRNGPPEKPILCNACGSRWRTKGTLINYTPLHARENVDQIRPPKVKSVDQGLPKRKKSEILSLQAQREEGEMAASDQEFQKVLEEDTSNRSSSGSAISYSESCSYFGSEVAAQSNIWDSLVPSRKRTCIGRPKPSSVEKLTMDLHSIMHQQPSYISTSPEDDLVYESEIQFGAVEIGYGSVLLRHPNPAAPDEESEASSLLVDTKNPLARESYSRVSSLPVNSIGKIKRSNPMSEETMSRDKASLERLYLLRSKDSPLTIVDLEKIVNQEIFVKHLTLEEKQQLMKYLPSIDATRNSESLVDLFQSPHFSENLSYFQQLLLEGTFDVSSSEVTPDECRTLKKLVLGSSTKSKWVEYYMKIKNSRHHEDKKRKGARTGSDHPEKLSNRSPKRSNKPKAVSILSLESPQPKSSLSFSPRGGIFESYDEEEEGLLLDLRPNGSFPEAELLSETWKQTSTSSSSSQPFKSVGL